MDFVIPKGNAGHNPNLGSYTDVNNAPTNDIQEGDYITVLDTTATPVTGTIYKWNDSTSQWESTGRDANEAYFGSGEPLIDTYIDDTNLENPVEGSLAKAKDVAPLKIVLDGYEVEFLNEDVQSQSHDGSFLRYIVNNVGLYAKTGSIYFECQLPDTQYDKIKFIGFHSTGDIGNCGFSFGHYEGSDFISDYGEKFGGKPEKINSVKYEFDFKKLKQDYPNATHFITTVKYSDSNQVVDSFYCRFESGDNIKEDIDSLDEQVSSLSENIQDNNEDIEDIKKALTYCQEEEAVPYAIEEGLLSANIGSTAEISTNTKMQVLKFSNISNSKGYSFYSYIPKNYNFYSVYQIDENGIVLDRQGHKSSSSEPSPDLDNIPIEIKDGTTEIWMNVIKSYSDRFKLVERSESVIDVNSLKAQVGRNTNDIQYLKSSSSTSLKLMKVIVDTSKSIIVRSNLSHDKDIAVTMYNNSKDNFTFKNVYIGDKGIEDNQLAAQNNVVNEFTDSTPPFNTTNFGYIYANHGWAIPIFTITSGSVTDADLNTEWVDADHGNRVYYIGKIEGDAVYLIPKITQDVNGQYIPSLNWWESNGIKPTTLTKADNGSRQITGSSDRHDLPVQVIKSTRYIADGVEVFVDEDLGSSTFYCNSFCVCQDIDCKAPWGRAIASDWFDSENNPLSALDNVFVMQRSYNFCVNSCTVNVSVNCESPIAIGDYFAVQPQMPVNVGNYSSKTYFPKAKKSSNLDYGISSNSSDTSSVGLYRNDSNLYNVDDLTDRVITVLEGSEDYLLGVASGMSLDKGMTIPSIRNTQVATGSSDNANVLTWNTSSSARNKCYFKPFKARGAGNDGWSSGIVNTDFVKDFVTYFSWFNPNDNPNQQVYWIKEGDYWLIYAHAQDLTGKAAINLPPQFEGMAVIDTLEKTDGATLLTSVVTGGRIYVKYDANDNGQANFITLKLK